MSDNESIKGSSRSGNDPLSAATRATKRNLLAASVLAIAFRAFDVTVDWQ